MIQQRRAGERGAREGKGGQGQEPGHEAELPCFPNQPERCGHTHDAQPVLPRCHNGAERHFTVKWVSVHLYLC